MQLGKNRTIALDTMVFIYYFEGANPFVSRIGKMLGEIERGTLRAVTTVITLSEILAKPLAEKNVELADEYKNVLNSFPHLKMIEINQHVATLAASLKAKYKIKLPDALQISGGLFAGAGLFISNDKKLKKVRELKVITLDQI